MQPVIALRGVQLILTSHRESVSLLYDLPLHLLLTQIMMTLVLNIHSNLRSDPMKLIQVEDSIFQLLFPFAAD